MDRVLETALALFSRRGFGATSMRDISRESGMSVGNLYHHFGSKEAIFQGLIDRYWQLLLDPEQPLVQVFARARFPEDLEEMADAIEQVVMGNAEAIMLIYIDVVEFRGAHVARFYQTMSDRFRDYYGASLGRRRAKGELGDVDPIVAVILATRWLFYFFTVEYCFGMESHFGVDRRTAVREFIRIFRLGLLPRSGGAADGGGKAPSEEGGGGGDDA